MGIGGALQHPEDGSQLLHRRGNGMMDGLRIGNGAAKPDRRILGEQAGVHGVAADLFDDDSGPLGHLGALLKDGAQGANQQWSCQAADGEAALLGQEAQDVPDEALFLEGGVGGAPGHGRLPEPFPGQLFEGNGVLVRLPGRSESGIDAQCQAFPGVGHGGLGVGEGYGGPAAQVDSASGKPEDVAEFPALGAGGADDKRKAVPG